jgi:hypothetical protein
MMKKLAILTGIALIATSGVAIAKRSGKEVPVANEIGKPVNCINLRSIQETRVRNDNVIDFRTSGRKWYRNTLPHSCPSLGFEERFLYKTSLTQLCNVDIITVLHSYGNGLDRGASCGLGQFQPVELVKTAAK